MTFSTKSAEETESLGEAVGKKLEAGDVVALSGNLAAGKTVFTKGIAKALGVKDEITSPTFCLISEYEGTMPLYHFDVYRLGGAEDFANLGAEEMLYGNGVCVIEWSEKVAAEIPETAIFVDIDVEADGSRKIRLRNWRHGEIGAGIAGASFVPGDALAYAKTASFVPSAGGATTNRASFVPSDANVSHASFVPSESAESGGEQ